MTQVDFYLQESPDSGSKEMLVCRLADKAFRLGHQSYVLASDWAQAQRLDELLWTYSAGSFVPHGLYAAEQTQRTDYPVLIGADEAPPVCDDVLICLRGPVPEWFSRFRRVAEIVGADADDKASARERYRFYRDRGYPLNTHKL